MPRGIRGARPVVCIVKTPSPCPICIYRFGDLVLFHAQSILQYHLLQPAVSSVPGFGEHYTPSPTGSASPKQQDSSPQITRPIPLGHSVTDPRPMAEQTRHCPAQDRCRLASQRLEDVLEMEVSLQTTRQTNYLARNSKPDP